MGLYLCVFDEEDEVDGVEVAWLVPITAAEAKFVADAGWKTFEQRLTEADPDLLDESRGGIA